MCNFPQELAQIVREKPTEGEMLVILLMLLSMLLMPSIRWTRDRDPTDIIMTWHRTARNRTHRQMHSQITHTYSTFPRKIRRTHKTHLCHSPIGLRLAMPKVQGSFELQMLVSTARLRQKMDRQLPRCLKSPTRRTETRRRRPPFQVCRLKRRLTAPTS